MRSHRLDSVATAHVMDHLIRRECARADRNGEIFSLVLFRVPGNGRRRKIAAHRLIRTMQKRARLTDDVGWLGQDYLAALLPDTTPQGAEAFADGVSQIIARHLTRPLSIVYSYPSDRAAIANAAQIAPVQELIAVGAEGPSAPMRIAAKSGAPALATASAAAAANDLPQILGRIDASTHHPSAPRKIRHDAPPTRLPIAGIEELLTLPIPGWKRLLDILFALTLAVLLAPVMAIAALTIKLTSKGPVIYTQRRSGLGGWPFIIYKFRTMVVDAEKRQQELRKFNEQDGPAFKLTRDPRVTRIGALLRKTSIDELPQLWNVLKGDMSLVGPRPLPVAEQNGCEQWQRHRLNVTPGLTCIWQVKGRSTVSFAEWVRMDVEYIRRRTILHDLAILFSTIPSVLLRKGAR